MKQVPFWRPTNIRYHCTKFSRMEFMHHGRQCQCILTLKYLTFLVFQLFYFAKQHLYFH